MIVARTYYPTAGSRTFFTPELMYVRLLGMKREGVGQTEIPTGFPGSREFHYTGLNILVSTSNRFNEGEKIWILYEE